MSEQLTVTITGKDGVSKVFETISRSADQVGDTVERAGKQGSQGMDQLGKSAELNAQRMERLKNEATAIGAVMGMLGSGIIAAGSAYRDQARQIDGITRIYGDQSDAIIQMTEDIQDFTRYSNDAARESALVASSLATNYDMTVEQIAQLVERSADLAQIYGYSLPDAVQRTSAALRGEGESAEMLGLNLSDAAVAARALDAGITNWNVPGALTEAEKAAFRFQLLMEDTQSTVGAAADAADGAGGGFRRFINEVDDGVEAVGRFLGPVGQVAAEMAPIAMALPVVTAGAGRMATTLRGSALAMGALGVATNPVTLALGALAVGGGLAWASMREGEDASKRLEGALLALGDTATNLRLSHLDKQADMLENFAQQVEFAEGTASQYFNSRAMEAEANAIAAAEGREYADVLNELRAGYRFTIDEANNFSSAQDKIRMAFADSRVDHEALSATLTDLYDQYASNQITLDEYGAGVEAVANNLDSYRLAAGEAAVTTAMLSEEFSGVGASVKEAAAEAAAAREEFQALTREWIAGMAAATGINDPLSQWNLTGNASDAAVLADNLTDAGNAADNMFRVIVGNTDAIQSQANATLSWAEELVNVRGELGRIDELVNAGLISGTSGVFDDGSQYAEAQNAYDSIADSVQRIEDNLDAVQAIQAPLMAEMTASTAAYTDQLLAMKDPAEQFLALSWADTATATQAMELAMLGASAASGELGANGVAAFSDMAVAAAQMNPALAAVLVDMQILEEHIDASGTKTYTVNTEGLESAKSDIQLLTESIDALVDMMDDGERNFSVSIHADTSELTAAVAEVYNYQIPQVDVPIVADTGAATTSLRAFEEEVTAPVTKTVTVDIVATDWGGDVLGAAQEAAGALGGGETATVTIEAVDNATAVIQDVGSSLAGLDSRSATVLIWGDEDEAMASIGAVGHNLATLDGATASVNVVGDNANAMAAIGDVQAYDGVTLATSYYNIVTRYSSIGTPTAMAGGIIDEYASGGYVAARLGEAGGEMLHLSSGGYAYAPQDGLYMTPLGSYVSPAPSSPNGIGGTSLVINVQGNIVGSNRSELNAWADQELIPRIERAVHQRRVGLGVDA